MAGGVRGVIGVIGAGIVRDTGADAMPVTVPAIVREAAMPHSKTCIATSATRPGQQNLPPLPASVPEPARRATAPTTSIRIVMVMFIARPIKAGRNGPKKAGNQSKAGRPRLNNKRPNRPKPNSKGPSNRRPSSSTAVIRTGNAVINGLTVTTRPGGTAAVAAVAVGVEVAVAVNPNY